jgi:5S rRNA maturation endonuclease (ribonuclease M5)
MPKTNKTGTRTSAMTGDGRGKDAIRSSLRITDEEKLAAKHQLAQAFSIAGLIQDGNPVCPKCSTSKKGKVQLKTSADTGIPYWKCHKCSERGDAISILTDVKGYEFTDAINLLIGRDGSGKSLRRVTRPEVEITPSFTAVIDVEIYNTIRDYGSLDLAQRYYQRWHISPEAVAEAGSRYITDAASLHATLLDKFGRSRLIACGVLTIDKNGKDFFLFNDDYPVIEVHASPAGHVVGMQFRPSPKRMLKVKAHKEWKRRWTGVIDNDGNELEPADAWLNAYTADPDTTGSKAPYVTPFLSLKGAGIDSLVGCGLPRIANLQSSQSDASPTKVYVVEGFKDLLAARTLGVEAYAIPGTGVMPPAKVCKILARHHMVVTLDGDEAGARGRANLMAWFKTQGVPAVEKTDMRNGMDIADILVERNAHNGCNCETCVDWRTNNLFDPSSCSCATCKSKRVIPT